MKSFADNLTVVNNDAADSGIGTSEPDAFARKFQRTLHEANVMFVHQLVEKRRCVGFRVERNHVVDLFASADETNGQSEFARNCHDDSALGGAIEFSQHNSRAAYPTGEFPCLCPSVLSVGSVHH